MSRSLLVAANRCLSIGRLRSPFVGHCTLSRCSSLPLQFVTRTETHQPISVIQRRFVSSGLLNINVNVGFSNLIDVTLGLVEKWREGPKPSEGGVALPLTSHEFFERPEAMKKIEESFRTLQSQRINLEPNKLFPVVVVLSGAPGNGKTQLGCEYAIRLTKSKVADYVVGWIDASDQVSTIRGLREIARRLNEKELTQMDSKHSNKSTASTRKKKLVDLGALLQRELSQRQDWLLVLDNFSSAQSPKYCLPVQGGIPNAAWGSGLVLVTTRDSDLRKTNYTAIIDNCRMNEEEEVAKKMLLSLSGVPQTETEGIKELAELLEWDPLSLANAGEYIKDARMTDRNFAFRNYIHNYENNIDYVLSQSKSINMRFEQFTGLPELGPKYEQLFMLLACTKNWKTGIPLAIVAQVLGGHPRPLKVPFVQESRLISRCTLLKRHDFAQYSPAGAQQAVPVKKEGLSENVEDNVQSVRFYHPLAHDAARKWFGLETVHQQSRAHRHQKTVLNAITALNNGYLDALQLESAFALVMRRQLSPLTRAFLEVADQLEFPLRPLDKALALSTQGDAVSTFEQPQEGIKRLEEALAIVNRCQGDVDITTVRIRTLLGIAYRQVGEADTSATHLKKALKMLGTLPNLSDIDSQLLYGDTHVNLGVAYTHLGKYEDAQRLFETALNTFKVALTDNHELQSAINSKIARCLSMIGVTKRKLVIDDLGENDFREALTIQETLLFPDIAFTLGNLAIMYRQRGTPKDLEICSEYLMKALDVELTNYGDRHMSVAITKAQLSVVRRRQGKMEDALQLAGEALKISTHVYGHVKAFHPGVANCLSAVARTKRDLGRLEDAEDFFTQSWKMYEEIYGVLHHKVIAQMNGLASVYRHMALPWKAEEILHRTLERCEKVHSKEQKARSHRILGHVYEMLDRPRDAGQHWTAAFEIYDSYQKKLRGVLRTSRAAVCKAHLAYLHKDLDNPHPTEQTLEALLEPYKTHKRERPYSAEMAHVYYVLGKLHLRTHNYKKAIEVFERVVRDQAELLGGEHPRLVVTLTALSAAQVGRYREAKSKETLGLLDDAAKSLERAEEIVGKKLHEDHLLAAEVYSNRGFLLCERHGKEGTAVQAQAAVDQFDKALSIRDKFLLKDNRKYAKSLAGKARAMHYMEENYDAMQLAQEARQYFVKSRERMMEVEVEESGTTRRLSTDDDLKNLDELISNISYYRRAHGYTNPLDQ